PVLDTCHTSEQPRDDRKYTWSNVELYETPAIPASQFRGTLTYTTSTCRAEYEVKGVWPAINCTVLDDNGDPALHDHSKPQADPTACCPNADSEKGYVVGSGLSPDFAVHCERVIDANGGDPIGYSNVFFDYYRAPFLCVLDDSDAFPVLNENGYPKGCAA